MSEIAQVHAADLESEGIRFEESQLIIPADTSFDRWLSLGQALQQMDRSIKWWVGDWLIFGETRAWGDKYPQAIQEATGYHYDSLRKAAFVSQRIETVRRRTELTWSHHDAVAGLAPDEQDEVLQLAEQGSWTVKDTREAAREVRMLPAAAREEKARNKEVIDDLNEEYASAMMICPHCEGNGVVPVKKANARKRKDR